MSKKEEILELLYKYNNESGYSNEKFINDILNLFRPEETPPEWAVAKVEFYTKYDKSKFRLLQKDVINFTYTPIKKPWRPKEGEWRWTIYYNGDKWLIQHGVDDKPVSNNFFAKSYKDKLSEELEMTAEDFRKRGDIWEVER